MSVYTNAISTSTVFSWLSVVDAYTRFLFISTISINFCLPVEILFTYPINPSGQWNVSSLNSSASFSNKEKLIVKPGFK